MAGEESRCFDRGAGLDVEDVGVDVPELGRESEAAVDAKILERHELEVSPHSEEKNHWSQKGIASSRSLPIPDNVFFWMTAKGRVAWPFLRAGEGVSSRRQGQS